MRIQNIDLFLYSLLWMCVMFFTVRVTEGKLGLDSPNMPKEMTQKVDYANHISNNKTTDFIMLKNRNK